MRLLYVVDGRSPIAMNWISYFVERGDEVHLVSTFSCKPQIKLSSYHFVPVAFSSLKSRKLTINPENSSNIRTGLGVAVGLRTRFRQWLGPFTLPRASRSLSQIIDRVQPDLVHAMRIPYEGMLAAKADPKAPLLISVWGNDFTLHATSTPWMGYFTKKSLIGADALHTDCQRDLNLAKTWGFLGDKPSVVLPGAGGIQLDTFHPSEVQNPGRDHAVINPRGIRAYIRNDTFFKAIPMVLKEKPMTQFYCPVMHGEPSIQNWVKELGIGNNTHLLPFQTRYQMAELFRRSRIVVSPSEHDGTPNTLLEAMACGCLPVVGDIESIREWITHGQNGLLFDPSNPQALADAILVGLKDREIERRARDINLRLIAERATYSTVMNSACDFYRTLY
jgi:glycosyltransferase involved in cell wall biosynthesis